VADIVHAAGVGAGAWKVTVDVGPANDTDGGGCCYPAAMLLRRLASYVFGWFVGKTPEIEKAVVLD
jgi:hypothetical protein